MKTSWHPLEGTAHVSGADDGAGAGLITCDARGWAPAHNSTSGRISCPSMTSATLASGAHPRRRAVRRRGRQRENNCGEDQSEDQQAFEDATMSEAAFIDAICPKCRAH